MKLLLDTHILLWSAAWDGSERLSATAIDLIQNPENEIWFSPASLWEVVIKHGLARADFTVDPHLLHRGLLDHDYRELAITGEHVLMVGRLPDHHCDPFDRFLIAQAIVEGITLLTSDRLVARYPGPIRRV